MTKQKKNVINKKSNVPFKLICKYFVDGND